MWDAVQRLTAVLAEMVAAQTLASDCAVSNENFGSNINVQTPASEQSQEQHHRKFQMSEQLM